MLILVSTHAASRARQNRFAATPCHPRPLSRIVALCEAAHLVKAFAPYLNPEDFHDLDTDIPHAAPRLLFEVEPCVELYGFTSLSTRRHDAYYTILRYL